MAASRTDELVDLFAEISDLRAAVAFEGDRELAQWAPVVERRRFAAAAINLGHYLALRRRDLRPLQQALLVRGFWPLDRCESRVLPALDLLRSLMARLLGAEPVPAPTEAAFFAGEERLTAATAELLGPPPRDRTGRIMVTVGREILDTPGRMAALITAGADIVRINCAHDDPRTWSEMVGLVRRAAVAHGRRVPILMDIPGPRIRTGRVRLPEGRTRIRRGDRLLLTDAASLDRSTVPFRVAVEPGRILARLRPGQRVYFDDGRFGGHILEPLGPGHLIEMDRGRLNGDKLRPGKGLNFPGADLGLEPLGQEDRDALDHVARLADLVGYSFVQRGRDIELLLEALRERLPTGAKPPGIVAKIETPLALRNLPEIVVASASRVPTGVMIARGDLAVELGFERVAEVQEELMRLCEAASVPVIWATQVLETLVKKGVPSRGEMTDAAMASRADCIMLNKGPFQQEGVAILGRLLARAAGHGMVRGGPFRPLRSL